MSCCVLADARLHDKIFLDDASALFVGGWGLDRGLGIECHGLYDHSWKDGWSRLMDYCHLARGKHMTLAITESTQNISRLVISIKYQSLTH